MIKYEKYDFLRIIFSLILTIAAPVALYIYLKASGSLLNMIVYCLIMNFLFYTYFRSQNAIKIISFWLLVFLSATAGFILLVKTTLYPYSVFEDWFKLFNNRGVGGKFPLLFVLFASFFGALFAGLLYSRKYIKPLSGFAFFMLFILTVIHRSFIFVVISIVSFVIILVVIITTNVKTKRYIRRIIFSLIFLLFAFFIAVSISLFVTPGGVNSISPIIQPEMIEFIIKLFPDLPIIMDVPGAGIGFDSKSFFTKPLFTPGVILSVQAKPGEVLYLRTKVMDYFDGFTWKISKSILDKNNYSDDFIFIEDTREGEPINITIAAELYRYIPHTISTEFITVPSVDDIKILHSNSNTGIILDESFLPETTLILWRHIGLNKKNIALTEAELVLYLSVPIDTTQRIRELAVELSDENQYKVIANIRKYLFEDFSYNLEIDFPLDEDVLDYFLFEAKEGYCVHYATAFVILARLNGIPVRYINGFLVYIPSDDDFFNVTGFNSHAWPEVWSPDLGWMQLEITPPMDPEVQRNSSFYNYFNMYQYSFSDQQLLAILGDVIEQKGNENEVQDLPYLKYLVIITVGIVLIALTVFLFFLLKRYRKKRIKILNKELRKYSSRLRRIVYKLSKKGVPLPERKGWINWKDNLIRKVPLQKDTITQLTLITQKAFFSTYLPVEEDINRVKNLSKELHVLQWI